MDERLNFTDYVSSDLSLGGNNIKRPDLLVYNRRVMFRGDNEQSNPITVFEFKKHSGTILSIRHPPKTQSNRSFVT